MKRHEAQAQQLYAALKRNGQTWTRDAATLATWAEVFEDLEGTASRKRIARCLDWFCNEGCGALYVPLIGTAATFADKFELIDEARLRLKSQELRYFDDVMKYRIVP